jgi:hypothetical protein
MKKTLFFLMLTSFAFAQGLIIDKVAYNKTKNWEAPEKYGFSTAMPSKISFREYTPEVLDQGKTATCVGYAVAYAQLSTQQNIKMGITNATQKIFRAMDPNFLYGFLRLQNDNDAWCQKGTSMNAAMDILYQKGSKPMLWYPWLACNSSQTFNDFTLALASNYSIDDYFRIDKGSSFISDIKNALYNKLIVSVGINLTESFESGTAIKYGNWSPGYDEKLTGGHAMCIIGYDDYRNGGSFEIMNSWGSNFGDNGYIWVKYSDFNSLASQAYVINVKGLSGNRCSMGDCKDTYSRYEFDNGDIYEGVVKNGNLDVFGSFIYNFGDFYVGQFQNGRRHGYGLYYSSKTGYYYKVTYNQDVLVDSESIQGFAKSKENLEQMDIVFSKVQEQLPGKLIIEGSAEFEKFSQSQEVPDFPISIKIK